MVLHSILHLILLNLLHLYNFWQSSKVHLSISSYATNTHLNLTQQFWNLSCENRFRNKLFFFQSQMARNNMLEMSQKETIRYDSWWKLSFRTIWYPHYKGYHSTFLSNWNEAYTSKLSIIFEISCTEVVFSLHLLTAKLQVIIMESEHEMLKNCEKIFFSHYYCTATQGQPIS